MERKNNFLFAAFLIFGFFFCSSPVWAMAKKPPVPQSEAGKISSPSQTSEIEKVTLYECYRKTLRINETLKIQHEKVNKTTADFLEAAGEAIGDGNFVTTDFLQDKPSSSGSSDGGSAVGSTLTSEERRERKFVFSQPLFQGFKSLGALTGAGSLRRQRLYEAHQAEENLFLDVAAAFYALLRQKKDIATVEEIRILLMDRMKELRAREKIGRSRESEVATAQASLKLLEAGLARGRGDLALAEQDLYFYTGMQFKAEDLVEPQIPYTQETPLADFINEIENRPDVKAAKEASKTARRAIVVAQSKLWPAITLESNHYVKREGFQSPIEWDVLFKMDLPLFTGGTHMSEVKTAISDWKQAKLTHSLIRRQAEVDIRKAYENWKTSLLEYEARQEAVKASKKNFDYQKDDYLRSLVSNLDVLAALQSLLENRRNANTSYYAMKEDFWKLQVSAGHCCQDLEQLEKKMAGAAVPGVSE